MSKKVLSTKGFENPQELCKFANALWDEVEVVSIIRHGSMWLLFYNMFEED